MQAVHLNKSCLRNACFPRNLRTAFFQNSCSNYLARPIFACFYKKKGLSYSICFLFLRSYLSFYICVSSFWYSRGVIFRAQSIFKMEFFAKIVKGFQALAIFEKIHLHHRCLNWFLMNIEIVIFIRFTCPTNLIQETSQMNRAGWTW